MNKIRKRTKELRKKNGQKKCQKSKKGQKGEKT